MIKFVKLEINNFRSFKGSHSIDLTQGLWLIRGENLDTNGESGAGKSSILLAIAYALGISPYSAKELLNWDSDKVQVTLYLIKDLDNIVISKGQTNSIQINDKVITGAKFIEETLQDIFALSIEQRAMVLYKQQLNFDNFLLKTNSEKRSFLNSILKLDHIESEIANVNNTLITLYAQTDAIADELIILKDRKNTLLNQQSELSSPSPVDDTKIDVEPFVQKLAVISNDIEKVTLDFKRSEDERQLKMSDLSNKIKDLGVPQESLILEQENANLSNKINDLSNNTLDMDKMALISAKKNNELKLKKIEEIKNQRIELIANYKKAVRNTCYTCNQAWNPDPNFTTSLRAQINAIEEEMRTLGKDVDRDDLHFYIKRIEQEKSELNSEIKRLKRLVSDNIKKIKLINANQQSEISAQLNEIKDAQNPHHTTLTELLQKQKELTNEKKSIEISNNEVDKKINNYNNLLQQYNFKLSDLTEKNATLDQEINYKVRDSTDLYQQQFYLNDKVSCLKGYLNYINNDILNEISNEVNTILESVPNVGHVKLEFNTERTTAKGEVKPEISCKVMINGTERSLAAGLSGGMFMAVSLAVDLAIRNIINRRTGVNWGILLIDEQFHGLDSISKASCLEILKRAGEANLVMMIDHDIEVKESIDKILTIKLKNGVSCIY